MNFSFSWSEAGKLRRAAKALETAVDQWWETTTHSERISPPYDDDKAVITRLEFLAERQKLSEVVRSLVKHATPRLAEKCDAILQEDVLDEDERQSLSWAIACHKNITRKAQLAFDELDVGPSFEIRPAMLIFGRAPDKIVDILICDGLDQWPRLRVELLGRLIPGVALPRRPISGGSSSSSHQAGEHALHFASPRDALRALAVSCALAAVAQRNVYSRLSLLQEGDAVLYMRLPASAKPLRSFKADIEIAHQAVLALGALHDHGIAFGKTFEPDSLWATDHDVFFVDLKGAGTRTSQSTCQADLVSLFARLQADLGPLGCDDVDVTQMSAKELARELISECLVCGEKNGQRIFCDGPDRHGICAPCVESIAKTALESSRGGRLLPGSLSCPCGGVCLLTPSTVCRSVSSDLFSKLVEAQATAAAHRAFWKEASLATTKVAKLCAKEGSVAMVIDHIKNEILIDRCPRCGCPYADFDGCCALRCDRCGCAFCAWCDVECTDDAHSHVVIDCLQSAGNLFGDPSEVAAARASRKRKRIDDVLSEAPAWLKRDVGDEIRLPLGLRE